MKFLPTVGLEVHSQLATNTKIFCCCPTSFGGDPNSHSCPVCLGMPGVLPVLNERAIELAIRMAILTNGAPQKRSYFARKNYFYPDLPKGYQISMFEFPVIQGGTIELDTKLGFKTIRLNRIHLEEDAGKLIHSEGRAESYFDVNRCGVPLIEIVTEPDFDTLEEVQLFLEKLRGMLVFSGASRGNMFQGNIRVDANISIRPEDTTELGTRTEIKNMNSFENAVAAIEVEIDRQIDVVSNGGRIVQETLLYDADKKRLSSMRSKEEAHDYRYFPEPDLVPVIIADETIERIRHELPEMQDELRARFERDYGIPAYDAEILSSSPQLAHYYEEVISDGADAKKASNWVMGEVMRVLNDEQIDISEIRVTAKMLAALLSLIDKGTISGSIAKKVFDEMLESGSDPDTIVKEKGLVQISDKGELEKIVADVVASNTDEVEKFRAGNPKLMAFFVGQVMKATRGKANPREVNEILKEQLG